MPKSLWLDGRKTSQASVLNAKSRRPMKAQTTMVLLLLVIVLFAGSVIFLLSFAKTINQTEYMSLYAHNMLLVLLRSDTGSTDPNCKLVSDTLSCAFFNPGYICGDTDCLTLANRTVTAYVARFGEVKKSYGYLLSVEPRGFKKFDENGDIFKINIGDQSIAYSRQSKYAANEQLRKDTASGVFSLDVRLLMVLK